MRIRSYLGQGHERRHVWGGAGVVEMLDVFGPDDFETPLEYIGMGRMSPGSSVGLHRHDTSEACVVVLDGPLAIAHGETLVEVPTATATLCCGGESHGILNASTGTRSFLTIGAAHEKGGFEATILGDNLLGAVPSDHWSGLVEPLDVSRLEPTRAHEGRGEIRFRRVWDHDVFRTNWGFIDHAVLPPGCSVGYHRHETVQECYLILSGSGIMRVDDEVSEVHQGDCVPNRLGGSHGIVNHTDEPVALLNVAMFVNRGSFDATDLGDDLGDLL